MIVHFPHKPELRFNEKHPANIIAGDEFRDTDGEGNQYRYIALRDAVRIRSDRERYRTTALREDGKIASLRIDGSRTITILGYFAEMDVATGVRLPADNDVDPALQFRDAAAEALDDAERAFDNDTDLVED